MIKTKKEAIDLQNKLDNILTEKLGIKTEISMSLSSRIKISWDKFYINLNREDISLYSIDYGGNYDDLLDICKKIKEVLLENSENINLLLESYGNISKLQD